MRTISCLILTFATAAAACKQRPATSRTLSGDVPGTTDQAEDHDNWPRIKHYLATQKAVSLERTVRCLTEAFRDEFAGNTVFLYDTASVQAADLKNPRAIMFAKDGSVSLSFNGDPRQDHYAALEIRTFDNRTNGTHFFDMQFSVVADAEPMSACDNTENKDKTEMEASKSETPTTALHNIDTQCEGCHGLGPDYEHGPIWDAPALAQRSYGGAKDKFNADDPRLDALKKFYATRLQEPPYRGLAPTTPQPQISAKETVLPNRPNLKMTLAVTAANAKRFAYILQKSVPYAFDLRYAILGTTLGCGDVSNLVPNELTQVFAVSYQEGLKKLQDEGTKKRAQRGVDLSELYLPKEISIASDDATLGFAAGFQYLLGQKGLDWSAFIASNSEQSNPTFAGFGADAYAYQWVTLLAATQGENSTAPINLQSFTMETLDQFQVPHFTGHLSDGRQLVNREDVCAILASKI